MVTDYQIDEVFVDKTNEEKTSIHRSTIYRQKLKLEEFLSSCKDKYDLDPKTFILDWALKFHNEHQQFFDKSDLHVVSLDVLPKQTRLKEISDKLCTDMIRNRKDPDCRKVSIKHAVKVVQEAGLHHQKGDVVALQNAIGSSYSFSSKVLQAVDSGQSEILLHRKPRSDSAKAGDISERLTNFLANPEHSRALPGHETISVAYGCRKPKFLLKKSKGNIQIKQNRLPFLNHQFSM